MYSFIRLEIRQKKLFYRKSKLLLEEKNNFLDRGVGRVIGKYTVHPWGLQTYTLHTIER